MNMKNSRGARRGVAKEMWRMRRRVYSQNAVSFVDHWRDINDPEHSRRREARYAN